MKTQEQIVERINQNKATDFFGFGTQDLIWSLDFEHAKPFLADDFIKKVEAGEEKWVDLPTDESVKAEITKYLDFAWDKCLGHRGISAGRSIAHFVSWCWLIGDDEAVAFLEDESNYVPYGAPCLAYLSKRYGFEMPDSEDAKRMARGDSCVPYCSQGCNG